MKNKFKKDLGGREAYFSCRFKKDLASDCVMRAIAIATGIDYLTVWTDLFARGLKLGILPNDKRCYEPYLESHGWVRHSPLKNAAGRKYRVHQFPSGQTAIIKTTRHLTALVNGEVRDSWDCRAWAANSYYTNSKEQQS